MKPKQCVTMALLSAAFLSVGLVLAGAANPESADPNAAHSPTLPGVSGDRVEWKTLEGQCNSVEECQEAVIRELAGATEEQWQQIGPKFRELEAVKRRTHSSIGVFAAGGAGGGAGGGHAGVSGGARDADGSRRMRRSYQDSGRRRAAPRQSVQPSAGTSPSVSGWLRPSQRRAGGQITEGERLCEELLDLIDRADASSEEIRQRMAQLAAYRRKAAEEVKQAKEALRQVVTRRQEAALILMGYLD
ncbi:MAG: hypothetical protein RBS72_19215 [Sedimentisphaerales bacterium]|jgi:Spy/CpxP family protein refolding chaperone|nr:hypothetical protein [Sedimentisphaerales bacterium]HNY79861.1 hypothetical protein [Sedimentisphaerales bacterium]HOC64863.1 hypothetical protein [Sedimentisphaerales bacterium]HOH65793.1 hypothetical protein [Sedimentisphaerales bacterium]HPY49053.1 hypothetical protein [Sedimentisphaerales bacterium]